MTAPGPGHVVLPSRGEVQRGEKELEVVLVSLDFGLQEALVRCIILLGLGTYRRERRRNRPRHAVPGKHVVRLLPCLPDILLELLAHLERRS